MKQEDKKPKDKQPENQLAKVPPSQLPATSDTLKAALQFAVDKTGEAKKAAMDNPTVTSTGKPKSALKGAAKITNELKEEGIEAHKRGIVSQPNMEGGLQNNDMHIAAKAALEILKLSEQKTEALPDKDDK